MSTLELENLDIEKAAEAFAVEGRIVYWEECFNGHINRTFFLTYDNNGKLTRYVLQMVNTNIFKKPDEVMENIVNVTTHISQMYSKKGIDPFRRTLNVIWTKDQKWGCLDEENHYWRMYDFVEDADCYMQVESAEVFEKVGYAFGQFQRHLGDFDASKLHESIPNFHNTEWRFANLEKAISENKSNRAHLVQDEIEFALGRKNVTAFIQLSFSCLLHNF